MENMEVSEHSNFLQQIFENVSTWLHFAEAKNAALIALNIALLVAIMESNYSLINIWLRGFILLALLVSIFLGIVSFWPINRSIEKNRNTGIAENLLHYAFIATLESEEYIKKIYSSYWGRKINDLGSVPQIEKDYCNEIIEIARITIRKQKYFKYSIYATVITIVILGILIIYG